MATSSFKSTTKRTTIGSNPEDSGSNPGSSLRRSRSLSRFSPPLSPEETPEYIKNAPRGKFVNTDRGSATFTEISLDDLAIELFSNESDWSADKEREGRGIRRRTSDTESSSRRRGRSVSRSCRNDVETVVLNVASSKNVNTSKVASGRSRSLSVARYQISNSEAKRRNQVVVSGDCSQSENPEFVQHFSSIREKYAATLEQSEKRKQNLLAEILLEEQRSQDLSKIIRELLPDSKSAAFAVNPSRGRKRNSDSSRMTKRLTVEAEKYFEGFISNVEDTDISSFDGERSDGSSTLGGTARARDVTVREAKSSCPVKMEGVVLPWLQWETSHDCSLSGKDKMQAPDIPETLLLDSKMDMNSFQDPSSRSTSTHASWSQKVFDCSISSGDESECKSRPSCQPSYFDMEECVKLQRNDEFLFELYREEKRINAGGLLLCTNAL